MKLRLADIRSISGKTQEEVASVAGVSPKTEWNWEQGKTFPNAEQICLMCDFFGTDPNDFLGWYDEHPEDRPSSSVTRDEAALIDNYRASPPDVRSTITQVARLGAGSSGKEGHDGSYEAEAV